MSENVGDPGSTAAALTRRSMGSRLPSSLSAADAETLLLFLELGERAGSLVRNLDTGSLEAAGDRGGQYRLDLVADQEIVHGLLEAGFDVLSEESGLRRTEPAAATEVEQIVVVDPIDGSTNASRGLRWWATSFALVQRSSTGWDLTLSLVLDHGGGDVFCAAAGRGAFRNGARLNPAPVRPAGEAIVGINGLAPRPLGWAQTRTFGALALDLCAVATGGLDAYIDTETTNHAPWDYLGGMLVLQECGGEVQDGLGRELVIVDHAARRSPVAATSLDGCEFWLEKGRSVLWQGGPIL